MRVVTEPACATHPAPLRMLFLPAAYTAPADFLQAGFAQAVRARGLPIDLSFADLTLQHLTDRNILRRIRHELVLPARAAGSHTFWMCGISLGGFIALAYAGRYPAEVDGLCLLAPYLGNHIVTGEIERAQGLSGWQPAALDDDDDERRVWQFIKSHDRNRVPLLLGFGAADRFASSHRMMAAALPAENVRELPGAHDWATWSALWGGFLDSHFGTGRHRYAVDSAGCRG
ncbi:MAG: alpha/beta fold hydrolase [Sinobacteraceae bacterium]|nr:alpha/beta fold hydrolase [Nevskiaceae bacterium]